MNQEKPDLRTLDTRHYLRRFRNLLVVLLMVGVFLQVFGVPRIRLDADTPNLRLVRLEQAVWIHVRDASAFVWSHLIPEFDR